MTALIPGAGRHLAARHGSFGLIAASPVASMCGELSANIRRGIRSNAAAGAGVIKAAFGDVEMKSFSKLARLLIAGMLVAFVGPSFAQQAYPNKPIRIIVPYPPGGSTDFLARLLGQKLTESWGQPVLVENRGGGNAIIGTEAAAKAAPDGYSLLLTSSLHVVVPQLVTTAYDPIKDFAAVATLTSTALVLVANPSVPASDLKELITLAKARPGELNYGTISVGSMGHLGLEQFGIEAGVKLQHIPYKGAGPVLAGIIGGQVQLYLANPINVVPHIQSGKLRGIAVTGAKRLPALPQVPTFIEGGLSGLREDGWQGILAPAATPRPIIDKLSAEIAKILAMPDIKAKMDNQGVEPYTSTPDQLAALMKADLAKYAKVIKAANIKLEE
jgi:tripartite-type tricarboxylate transporter receptor subunit TctC